MTGGDHLVVHKFFRRAEVARQALLRAPDQITRVIHPRCNGLLVRPATRDVRPEPRRRGPVAAFAGDAFIQFECLGARVRRHVKRVASETLRRLLRLAHAKNPANALAHLARKRLVGLRVLILDDPNAVFVLENAAIGAGLDAPVATRGAARAGPRVLTRLRGRTRGPRRSQGGKKNRAAQNDSAPQRPALALRPDSHSFARMERDPRRANRKADSRQKFLYCP